MTKYTADNTRKFKRVQAHSLVKFQTAEQWGTVEPFLSNIKDLSAGGLSFWSEVFFPEGTLLRVSAWIPALEKPVDALARVLRVRAAKSAGSYYLSVRFIEADQDIRNALNSFIEDLAANPKTRRFSDDFNRNVRRSKLLGRA